MCICDNKGQSSDTSSNAFKRRNFKSENGNFKIINQTATSMKETKKDRGRRLSFAERIANTKSVRTHTYNYVLGISSLWLLLPATVGVYNIYSGIDVSFLSILRTIIVCLVPVISALMWKEKIPGSFLFNADVVTASSLYFVLLSEATYWSPTSVPLLHRFFFPSIVAVPWIITCVSYSYSLHLLAFIGHNLFRYSGFWWVYYSVRTSEKSFAFTFLYFSFFYLLHIGYSVTVAQFQPRQVDVCKVRYWRGCFELVIFVAVLNFFHAMYNM